MLEPGEISLLQKIADKAIESIQERGFTEIYLVGIQWDEDCVGWMVEFYCEEGNLESRYEFVKSEWVK